MKKIDNKIESENIIKVIQGLRNLKAYLKSMIIEKKLEKANKKFNLKLVFQSIRVNVENGITYVIFAFLYLCLFIFGILFFLKINYPKNTGLFYTDDGFIILGHYQSSENITEVFGNWLIPVICFSSLCFYIIITIRLKIIRKKKE